MTLLMALVAMAICLVSLVTAVAFLTTLPNSSALPVLITWITVSGAAFYVFFCLAIVSCFRFKEDRRLEVSELRPKSGFSIETDSNAGEPPKHSASTFHWESNSLRMNEGLDQRAPRSPETVLHYPLRSSYLRLPALTFTPLLSPKSLPPMTPFDFTLHPVPSPSLGTSETTVRDASRVIALAGGNASKESLSPNPTLDLSIPPMPSPFIGVSEIEVRDASPVSLVKVGKASVVHISPPPKRKPVAKIVRVDSTKKVREATKKMVDNLRMELIAKA